jgi:hypothetical protein
MYFGCILEKEFQFQEERSLDNATNHADKEAKALLDDWKRHACISLSKETR